MSSAASTEDPGLRPWQFFLLAGMLSATGVVLVATGQSPASIIVLSLTVVSASFVALGAYRALAPLTGGQAADMPVLIVGRTRAALEREKTLAVRAIKELEFDYAMKKISPSDYEEMGARLRARAMGLMKQLDEGGYRTTIEQELARRLGPPSRPGAASPGAAGATSREDQGFSTRKEGQGFSPGQTRCSCGTSNDADARFCKNCGAKMAAA